MKSLEELKAIRERNQGKIGVRSESETQTRVVVGKRRKAGAYGVVRRGAERSADREDQRDFDRLYRAVPVRADRRGDGAGQGEGNLCEDGS